MKNYTLIAGGTSSVGIEIARLLKKEGRKIIFHGNNNAKINLLKQEFNDDLFWEYDFKNISNLGSDFRNFIVNNNCNVTDLIYSAGIFKPLNIKNTD